MGWGGACAQLRPRSHFVGPFVRASSLHGPWFPVCTVSLSDCAPFAALNGRTWSLLARSDAVHPPPSPRPQTGRPGMTNAYGHTTGNTPDPVRLQKLSPVSTEVGDHFGTLGAVRFFIAQFPALPRGAPHIPPPIHFLPSLPTRCTHGACATACRHAPGSSLPRQPAARAVLSSFQDMADSVGSARS